MSLGGRHGYAPCKILCEVGLGTTTCLLGVGKGMLPVRYYGRGYGLGTTTCLLGKGCSL